MEAIRYIVLLVFTMLFLIVGCKSPAVVSETVEADKVEESIFAARQDTVKIQAFTEAPLVVDRAVEEIGAFFTVQIGAYKQPLNAEQVNRQAQQRFNLETSTNYDATDELYKITVGQFTNYGQARTFCDRIMREFPSDYYDAWVVEISNRQRRTIQ